MKKIIAISISVLVVAVLTFFYFYEETFGKLPTEVVHAIKHGNAEQKHQRIRWMAERYNLEPDFWRAMVVNPDDDLRRASYIAMAAFRKNIPETFFPRFEANNDDDKLAIYTAMVDIAPFCDMRLARGAVADIENVNNEIMKAAYCYLSVQSVEDWTKDEVIKAKESGSLLLRWVSWWQSVQDMPRRQQIENYTEKLLVRYCDDNIEIRDKAWGLLYKLYGQQGFGLPTNETKPDYTECTDWWNTEKEHLLDQVMEKIKNDEIYYKNI